MSAHSASLQSSTMFAASRAACQRTPILMPCIRTCRTRQQCDSATTTPGPPASAAPPRAGSTRTARTRDPCLSARPPPARCKHENVEQRKGAGAAGSRFMTCSREYHGVFVLADYGLMRSKHIAAILRRVSFFATSIGRCCWQGSPLCAPTPRPLEFSAVHTWVDNPLAAVDAIRSRKPGNTDPNLVVSVSPCKAAVPPQQPKAASPAQAPASSHQNLHQGCSD